MSTGVKLEPIAQLLNKEFFIRSYQRGYRWDGEQVLDLLNDFKDFIDQPAKSEEEFYCLQPIVVKELSDDEMQSLSRFAFKKDKVYEVIDGQQRITTITILLHFLTQALENEIDLHYYPLISYEVREQSKQVLSNFNAYITSEEKGIELEDNIDYYHMKIVYTAIKSWFTDKKNYLLPFLRLLTSYKINCVKVIWYEVEESENSIEVFRRFNVGKIPLTNAELIKALLLKDDANASNALKYSISKEWQQIENQLQSNYFWSFLSPDQDYTCRIEYIFNLMFAKSRKNLEKQDKAIFDDNFGTDKHKVFRYFMYLITKDKGLSDTWDKINEVFEKMVQWYNHPEHYHYIGYLQNRDGKSKDENIILDILSYRQPLAALSFQNKSELTDYLTKAITSRSKDFFKDGKIKLSYTDHKQVVLRDFFFLFNVETCVKLSLSSNGEDSYRLPFGLNGAIAYDIEHIDSKTEKEIDSLEPQDKIDYLKDLEIDFGEEIGMPFTEVIAPLFHTDDHTYKWEPGNIKTYQLKDVLEKALELVDSLFEKDPDRFEDKNIIGNLALLNGSINRGYGNSYFNTKRRLIIEKDKEGVYIPVTTRNIFLKYYSGTVRKHTRWGINDAHNYTLDMETTLKKFM